VLDPFNVGLLLTKGKCGVEQMSAKCLKKNDANEKVGNFLLFKNHPMMLDYMEVPNELKTLTKDNGDLVYNACNILDYLISVKFVKKILHDDNTYKELIKQFHILPKKFKHCEVCGDKGDVVACDNVDGLKFEIFFNSIFEFAGKDGLLLLEIEREKEFAPVKNHEGELTNTPSITRMKMSTLFKKLYTNIGGKLLNDNINNILEFSLLINFNDETHETFFKKYPHIPKEIDMSKGNVYYDYYSV
jgi:UDP-N-acetylglucosamine pyrophosphorylase